MKVQFFFGPCGLFPNPIVVVTNRHKRLNNPVVVCFSPVVQGVLPAVEHCGRGAKTTGKSCLLSPGSQTRFEAVGISNSYNYYCALFSSTSNMIHSFFRRTKNGPIKPCFLLSFPTYFSNTVSYVCCIYIFMSAECCFNACSYCLTHCTRQNSLFNEIHVEKRKKVRTIRDHVRDSHRPRLPGMIM